VRELDCLTLGCGHTFVLSIYQHDDVATCPRCGSHFFVQHDCHYFEDEGGPHTSLCYLYLEKVVARSS
jgi:DNA-directed RNA polymerase subunit RPC12/RpoP